MAETSFVGNLVAEPEIRLTREGKPWAAFTIVHSDRVKDQAGNWADGPATYLDCVMFSHGADNLGGMLKGTRLLVSGKLQQQTWEKDGQKRSKLQLNVDEAAVSVRFGAVSFHKVAGGGQGASSGGYAGQGSPQAGNAPQNDGWATGGQAAFGGNNEAPF